MKKILKKRLIKKVLDRGAYCHLTLWEKRFAVYFLKQTILKKKKI